MRLRISDLISSGGDPITIPASGVTCIVGGNNAGKSQLLRDLYLSISSFDTAPVTLSSITGERPVATVEETEDWLESHAVRLPARPGQSQLWTTSQGESRMSVTEIQRWFADGSVQGPLYLGNAAPFFVQHSTAGSLSEYATGIIEPRGGSNAPLSLLFRDGELEEALSTLIDRTFGIGLVLDRINAEIRLRVGSVTVPVPPVNRPTAEYAEAVAALPTLDVQGDGMRSFVGVALHVLTAASNVFLVDEPEAFLHPGQARALGRWLAAEAIRKDVQIILATHDRDIVLGLLEAGVTAPVNVVRIARQGNVSHLSQLAPDEVRAVWDDPVLRYSNVLQGLFHRKVVICESDADCRFFGAALNELAIKSARTAHGDDVLFVPSGSKNRVAALAIALTKLGVEAAAIVDFDVLRVSADIRGIVQAVGGVWDAQIEGLYKRTIKSDNQLELWARIKNLGLAGLAPGDPSAAGPMLLELLAAMGIFVVPLGEMEDYDRTIALHGAAWVSSALERGVHQSAPVTALVEAIF